MPSSSPPTKSGSLPLRPQGLHRTYSFVDPTYYVPLPLTNEVGALDANTLFTPDEHLVTPGATAQPPLKDIF